MTTITIKTDPQIKTAAKELFAQFGVDMTTAGRKAFLLI